MASFVLRAEIGDKRVEGMLQPSGEYQLTLAFSEPTEDGSSQRQRSRVQIVVPPGVHLTERFTWDGTTFVSSARTEDPLPANFQAPLQD